MPRQKTIARKPTPRRRGGADRKKPTPVQTAERLRFAARLFDALATRREILEGLQRPPKIEEGRNVGGLGLTPAQAEHVYRTVVERRGEEFRDEQTVARSEQAHRLRAALSTAFRKGNLAAVARFETLYGKLYGTFAPTRLRVEGTTRSRAENVLAGLSDDEIERLLAEEGEEGEEEGDDE